MQYGENVQLKKVLVIEDNSLNLERVRNFLEIRNCKILEARTAEAGFLIVEKYPPDLILLGSQPSCVDKRKTFERIKSVPALRDVPVISIADVSPDQILRKKIAGWDSYLATQSDSEKMLEPENRILDYKEKRSQLRHHILRMQSQYYVSVFLINYPI
jgi:CheY-like chemotaxis protein